MDAEATDDMEMEERNEQEAAEQEGEEETSFTDDQRRDESILLIDTSNPVFVGVDNEEAENTDRYIESKLRDLRSNDGVKQFIIHTKKEFLKDGLGITVNKGDGPSSTMLYDKLRTTTSEKTNKINGARYRGKKILLLRGDKMVYSKSKVNEPYVSEFKELLKRAHIEHQKTPAALAERRVGIDVTQDTMDNIVDNVSDRIESEIDNMMEDITTNTEITNNELREFRGILNVKGGSGAAKIEALKIESVNWKNKAEEEGNTPKGKLYEAISKVADLKADEIRLRLNLKPESEEVTNMVEEEAEVNDLTRFEKFKKWARGNLLGLSSVAISVAGVITTVVMAGRNALKKGGDALDKLAKSVGNAVKKFAKKLGKNFGPIISALGTIILSIIKFLAGILLFLGNNLWILFLAVTYLIYNEYKSWRDSRRR